MVQKYPILTKNQTSITASSHNGDLVIFSSGKTFMWLYTEEPGYNSIL